MTFLPIVERELRLAARRPVTFWLRIVAALVALVIAGGLFTLFSLLPGGGISQFGGPMFAVLTWMSLVVTLAAGLFFTADSLSEEKREGTLGFLFLTDLRGYDVVLGKLFVTSCRCVFALLAIFPILACTQLFGGVEVRQFWSTILALLHALFFSLSVGMFVSALSHHPQKALVATLGLLLLFAGGGPAIDGCIAAINGTRFMPRFSLVSPVYLFIEANFGGRFFWASFFISAAAAGLLLVTASFLIPRNWQERGTQVRTTASPFRNWWRFGSVRARSRKRAVLLEKNPLTWVACRERWQGLVLWALVLLVLAEWVVANFFAPPWYRVAGGRFLGGLVTMILYLWLASQSCQVFADLRRSGIVELLLAASLDARRVALAAWLGLVRLFALPLAMLLLLRLVSDLTLGATWGGVQFQGGGELPLWLLSGFTAVCNLLTSITSFIAVTWFGLWMGLTSKNSLTGTLKTVVFVFVVPWFAISFATGLTVPLLMLSTGWGGMNDSLMRWFPFLMIGFNAVLVLVKNWVLWQLAWRKMSLNFRDTATRAALPVAPVSVLPPVINPPTSGQ